MKPCKKKKIIAFGYVKKEDGVYTAICVNMGLFGQGDTPEEALDNVMRATESYIDYILENHPDDCEKYFNRPLPISLLASPKGALYIMKIRPGAEHLNIHHTGKGSEK